VRRWKQVGDELRCAVHQAKNVYIRGQGDREQEQQPAQEQPSKWRRFARRFMLGTSNGGMAASAST
jgi:hypothetical protein